METRSYRISAKDIPAQVDALVALGFVIINIEEKKPYFLLTIDTAVDEFMLLDATTDVLLLNPAGDKLLL